MEDIETSPMNPEVKALWLNALRSGEYQQGTGKLKQTYGGDQRYCCLGVLCDLKPDHVWGQSEDGATFFSEGDSEFPSAAVTDWAGLPTYDLRPSAPSNALNYLAERNDGGYTFSQIADWIEANL